MKRYQIRVTPRADAEAMLAFQWLAERSPDAANRWVIGLEKAIAKIADNPERHPLALEESERFGIQIRRCLYGKRRGIYRIFFHVEEDTISVLAIRHSAQDTIQP